VYDTASTDLNPTDISTERSYNRSTDHVLASDSAYPETWYGAAGCLVPASSKYCNQWRVRLNQSTLGSNQTWWNKTACHEFGHTGGLDHRTMGETATCMVSGQPANPNYDTHDRTLLNSRY
jgi:hypothetical protein